MNKQFFVQYHNADVNGNWPYSISDFNLNYKDLYFDDQVRYDSWAETSKNISDKIYGSFGFLIVWKTEQSKKEYYLWSFFRIEEVDDEVGSGEILGHGFNLKKPILLNNLNGFQEFKKFCGNFGLGFQNISKSPFTQILISQSGNRVRELEKSLPITFNQKFYWVNQGQTFDTEYKGGYLWAPLKSSNGKNLHYWDNLRKLKKGDIVLNYNKLGVVGYSIVLDEPYNYPKPNDLKGGWDNEGTLCEVKYELFDKPISRSAIYKMFGQKMDGTRGIFNKNGKVNEGYLFVLSHDVGKAILKFADIEISNIDEEVKLLNTESIGLSKRRIGQGKYRRDVLHLWRYKCAVTGSLLQEVLVASHIVPWITAKDIERIDPHNSILLSPLFDALFDKYLISFEETGKIVISRKLSKEERQNFGIIGTEKIHVFEKSKKYLMEHLKLLR